MMIDCSYDFKRSTYVVVGTTVISSFKTTERFEAIKSLLNMHFIDFNENLCRVTVSY